MGGGPPCLACYLGHSLSGRNRGVPQDHGGKEAFLEKFPPVRTTTATSRTSGVQSHPRAGGQCDYTLDGANVPLDITRELDLLAVTDADFTVNRLE